MTRIILEAGEVERVVEALEFYADHKNWKYIPGHTERPTTLVPDDFAILNSGGGRARLTLALLKSKQATGGEAPLCEDCGKPQVPFGRDSAGKINDWVCENLDCHKWEDPASQPEAPPSESSVCGGCNGKGIIISSILPDNPEAIDCPTCQGTGKQTSPQRSKVTGPHESIPQVPDCACDAINASNCPIHGNTEPTDTGNWLTAEDLGIERTLVLANEPINCDDPIEVSEKFYLKALEMALWALSQKGKR